MKSSLLVLFLGLSNLCVSSPELNLIAPGVAPPSPKGNTTPRPKSPPPPPKLPPRPPPPPRVIPGKVWNSSPQWTPPNKPAALQCKNPNSKAPKRAPRSCPFPVPPKKLFQVPDDVFLEQQPDNQGTADNITATVLEKPAYNILSEWVPPPGSVEFHMDQGPNSVRWGTQPTRLFTTSIEGCTGIFFASPLVGTGLHVLAGGGQTQPSTVTTIPQFEAWLSAILKQQASQAFEAFKAIHATALNDYYNQWVSHPLASDFTQAGIQYQQQFSQALHYVGQLKVIVLIATPPPDAVPPPKGALARPDVMRTAREQITAHIRSLDSGITVQVIPYDDQKVTFDETYMQSTWGNLPSGVVFNDVCRPF